MARYIATIETDWPPEATFEYMANFATSQEWDPGVLRAEALTPDPLAVGARFGLVASFLGREVELEYETIELEAPRRVVLRAESGTITSLDEMTFAPTETGGTELTYDADLRLKGLLRVFEPILRLTFNRVGDKARGGIVARLSQPAPERPHAANPDLNGSGQVADPSANGGAGSEAHAR